MTPFLLYLIPALFLGMMLYFKIADKYNIIDKPNERSSHEQLTIRGGGVIFLLAGLGYAIYSGFNTPYFWVGFFTMGILGFADDVLTLPSGRRLLAQLAATGLMLFQALGTEHGWWVYLIALIIATGVTNAYNFMDGVNGITAAYSVAVLGALSVINTQVNFVDQELILALLLSALVFGFYNFRKKARCFAGDVGSVSMAFAIVYFLLLLIVKTEQIGWILLLLVYGVDTVLTIIRRLRNRENIFEAHRQHLYQWMTRPGPLSHLQVASLYAFIQLIVNALLIAIYFQTNNKALFELYGLLVLFSVGAVYVFTREHYKKKYEGQLT